jgi:hypothetical protein
MSGVGAEDHPQHPISHVAFRLNSTSRASALCGSVASAHLIAFVVPHGQL